MFYGESWKMEPRWSKTQALILAGGLGTRLRTIVKDKPKPMVRIAGKPFLAYQLEFLRSFRVTSLILCVGHLHEHVQAYFGDGDDWGVKIQYSVEDRLLGTAGALKNAEKFVEGTFLALNGDSFFDLDLAKFIQFHENRGGLGTIALKELSDASCYGSVRLNAENMILSFEEKSEKLTALAQINAGIYILEPTIFDFIPRARKTSLERETFPSILEKGHRLFGYPTDAFFVDVGTPEGLHMFRNYIEGARG